MPMAADTVQFVVEREQALERRIREEREKLAEALETHRSELATKQRMRIELRERLYERQLETLERELAEEEERALEIAHAHAARLELPDEAVAELTRTVLEGFTWRPNPSTK